MWPIETPTHLWQRLQYDAGCNLHLLVWQACSMLMVRILAARAAETFGIPFTLSSLSICSIEDVARQTSRPFWFQLYVFKDRDLPGS